jgi:hypothetical protein
MHDAGTCAHTQTHTCATLQLELYTYQTEERKKHTHAHDGNHWRAHGRWVATPPRPHVHTSIRPPWVMRFPSPQPLAWPRGPRGLPLVQWAAHDLVLGLHPLCLVMHTGHAHTRVTSTGGRVNQSGWDLGWPGCPPCSATPGYVRSGSPAQRTILLTIHHKNVLQAVYALQRQGKKAKQGKARQRQGKPGEWRKQTGSVHQHMGPTQPGPITHHPPPTKPRLHSIHTHTCTHVR